MPIPLLLVRQALFKHFTQSGKTKAVAGVEVNGFQKAIQALQKNWKGKNCPKKMDKVKAGMAGMVLARIANNIGVTSPKGQFKKTIKQGQKHIQRKFKWRPIKQGFKGTGPLPRGIPAPSYKHALKAIKVNGYWHYYDRAYITQKRGQLAIAEKALDKRKKVALRRVASSKSGFFGVALKLKLPVGHFHERTQLRLAWQSTGAKFQRLTRGVEIKDEKKKGYLIRSTSRNMLNPHVRGLKQVNAAIKGSGTTIRKLIKEGYADSMEEITGFLFKSVKK